MIWSLSASGALGVALTFLLAGFVKGLIGLGLPTVAAGLLGLAMTPAQAASLLIVPSFVTNVWQLATGPALLRLTRRLGTLLMGVCAGTWIGLRLLVVDDGGGWATPALGAVLMLYAATGLRMARASSARLPGETFAPDTRSVQAVPVSASTPAPAPALAPRPGPASASATATVAAPVPHAIGPDDRWSVAATLRRRIAPRHERWLAPLVGIATGIVTGATGVFVIPAVPYLQALDLDKEELMQALGLSFTVSTIALAGGLVRAGAFDAASFSGSLLALVPALAGMTAGAWLRRRVPHERFRRWFFLGLLALGFHLLLQAWL